MSGFFLVLEGGEGVGKSTQIKMLEEWLRNNEVAFTSLREPGGTVVGEEIRRILLDPANALTAETEALLFMASRAQIVQDRIVPALARGEVVVLDRFFLSTYAYQIHGRGLTSDRIVGANQLAVSGLIPDVTLIISLSQHEGMSRAATRAQMAGGSGIDRIEAADSDFHGRVHSAFAEFVTPQWQAQHPEAGKIMGINADGSPSEVFARILNELSLAAPAIFKR